MTTRRKSGALVVHPTDFDALPLADRLWRRCPWVDRETGCMSITRSMAIYFAILVGHIVERTHDISWTAFLLALTAGAMAFGKSYFGQLLTRLTIGVAGTANTSLSVVNETRRTIEERRDYDRGHEPTP
jgi:hypothetical protein